jgi:arylsulfatase A-like enzyme
MLSDRYLTMAEVLRAQGFVTASFIQNANAGRFAGAHQGFSSLRTEDTIGVGTDNLFGERVLDWLDKNGDRNFFLYLHTVDPHGVYDPPPPYDRWYRDAPAESLIGKRRLPYSQSLDPAWADAALSGEARRLLYDGEIRHNDAVIERFFAELEERNLLEDTLLILIADHGEWLGERGAWGHHPPGNRPVIHVPLMISYPKLFDTPKRIDDPVQLVDVMPTILELAAVDRDDLLMHGDSLLSLIQGTEAERWRDRITVSEEPMIMKRSDPCTCGSLFFDQWQLHGSNALKSTVYRFREDGVVPLKSYMPDLYTRFLRFNVLSKLQSANIEMWRKLNEGYESDVYTMDPATLEKLRGLGYIN